MDDFAPGQRFGGATRIRIEKERIKTFAAEFDPQLFHLDEQAAEQFDLRGPCRERLAYGRGNDAAFGGE